jgi:hypothetical protein
MVAIETHEVVRQKREIQGLFAAHPIPVGWDQKRKRVHQMRSDSHESRPFMDQLTHAANKAVLEVAEPTVDDSQRIGRSGVTEISLLYERH